MSIPNSRNQKPRSSTWQLLLGLFGIANFGIGCWSLLPPTNESIVYFWIAQFYDYLILPSLLFFPVSIIIVAIWLSRLTKKGWGQFIVSYAGIIIALLGLLPAVGTVLFLSNLHIVGSIRQTDRIYYLVAYYDDVASNYAICESDHTGFSGQCTYIAWNTDSNDPNFYVDQETNLITVQFEHTSIIWGKTGP